MSENHKRLPYPLVQVREVEGMGCPYRFPHLLKIFLDLGELHLLMEARCTALEGLSHLATLSFWNKSRVPIALGHMHPELRQWTCPQALHPWKTCFVYSPVQVDL